MTEDELDYVQDICAGIEDTNVRSEIPDLATYRGWSAGSFQSKGVKTCEEQDLDSLLATPMENVRY